VTPQDEAVYFNAVPLFVLAAVYLLVAIALAPTLWRERRRVSVTDVALASLFPGIAIPAAIFGAVVLHDRSPIGGHVWPSFAAILIVLVPAVIFLRRWSEPAGVVMSGPRAREAEQLVTVRDRELEAVARIVNALSRTQEPVAAARVLLDEVSSLLGVEFTALAVIDEERTEAVGLVARSGGEDQDWWSEMRLDLNREPSGIASAYFEAAPVAVYDVESSAVVSRRLASAASAKSGAFVPLIVEERVIGVLVAAPTQERRVFSGEDLRLMQALAGEAAIALDRTRSASALDQALARERLVARISRRVRSVHDLDAVTRVAVTETGRALGASRCFIRLGEPDEGLPLRAEWFSEGLSPIGQAATSLPVSNLVGRERRTVTVADTAEATELDDPALGGREILEQLGTRSVLATPIVVFDRMVGVLGLHRPAPGAWDAGDVSLAESVAREIGLALHTTSLLEENERRLGEQAALLKAAQVVTSELELTTVLQRLVDEVAELLGAEAADCYLYDAERGVMRCAAVHGFPTGTLGFEVPAEKGLSGRAISRNRPVVSDDYSSLPEAVPHPAYEGFRGAIVAPMRWSGEVKGILGVGTRDPERRFTPAHAELLEAFANLAALALRNAESFSDRSRQAQVQRGFYRIAAVLGEPISLEETLDALAHAACDALGGSSAAVLTPRDDDLRLTGLHGLPGLLVKFLEDGLGDPSGPLRSCARSRRVMAAPRLLDDDRFDEEWRRVAQESGYHSLLAIPVETPRSDEGALVLVFFDDERRFTDDDLELARNLAGAARGALERSELFEGERRSRTLAQELAQTSSLLATELEPSAVLDEVVRQAPGLMGADAAVIRLLDGDELVAAAASEDAASALDSRVPSTARLAGDAVQSRSPVAVADAREDQRLLQADPLLADGYAAYAGVPLVGPEGTVHGVLAVYAREPRAWREEEVEALAAFGANASAALSSAQLYQSVALEKERSVAILSNIADGIVAVDRDGKVVLWNAAAEQITGVPAEEALERRPIEVVQRELESEHDAPAGERLVSIRRGSEEIWLSLTEAVMRDPAGAVAGRIFAFRDISAERVVEQMKSEFVSNVSRELRSPLTSIYGFAETLMREDVLFGEEERATFLGYIASEAGRLTAIVDRLLAVARLDSGDLQVQLAPTDVGGVVSEVVSAAKHSLGPDRHEFVLDLPAEPLVVVADREKLRQIVTDLVDNAVKYSPGGGEVRVSARRRDDDAVEVSVEDDGIGIPEGEQSRIFAKFYRAETAGRDLASGGSGLGLFIAKELVAAMRGRIWVHSREGEGSKFAFSLPASPQPVLAVGSEPASDGE
jgi:PAS domain S-box-containing protein